MENCRQCLVISTQSKGEHLPCKYKSLHSHNQASVLAAAGWISTSLPAGADGRQSNAMRWSASRSSTQRSQNVKLLPGAFTVCIRFREQPARMGVLEWCHPRLPQGLNVDPCGPKPTAVNARGHHSTLGRHTHHPHSPAQSCTFILSKCQRHSPAFILYMQQFSAQRLFSSHGSRSQFETIHAYKLQQNMEQRYWM